MYRLPDIINLVIAVPTALLIFFLAYPIKWKDRKYIFGVRNREDFKNENAISRIDELTSGCRKQALIIIVISLLTMGLILFIPDMTIRLVAWTIIILLEIIILSIPYMRGNAEMKSLKAELGIVAEKGITYTELKGAGSVSAFKLSKIVVPEIITVIVFAAALLNDLGVIQLHGLVTGKALDGTLIISPMTGCFLIIGIMMIPIGIYMDKIRNEVISEDSDININFNRAKKKNMADTNTAFVWINMIFVIFSVLAVAFTDSEFVFIVLLAVYMIVIMVGLFLSVRKMLAIDRHYRKSTTIDIDDDDNWILGSIYYNPDDKRLNVEKREGIGITVNAAHPVGKALYAVIIVVLLGTIFSLGFVAVLVKTPMTVSIQNGNVICHQMKDDYKIPVSSIKDPELGELDYEELSLRRQYGMATDKIQKGVYTVKGEIDCKVFLNSDSQYYITFHSGDDTYYINASSSDETKELYEQLTK